jgi:Skp family chaperone for outer membrane proteins
MSELARVLSELQSVRTEFKRGQDELRRGQDELRKGQESVRTLIAEEVAGLVTSFSMLGEELHRDFQAWSQEVKGGVIDKVEDLRRQMSQIRSCSW